jgi:hypothetical protein
MRLIASNGRFFLPHRHIHHLAYGTAKILRGDERGFRHSIAWNDRSLLFHDQDIDSGVEGSLPVWHAVIIQEPPIHDPAVFQIGLLEGIHGFESTLSQRGYVDGH